LLLLGGVLVHFGRRLLTLNHLLSTLELLVFLKLGLITEIDALADVRISKPVMGFPLLK
jgi:hypothetical protein